MVNSILSNLIEISELDYDIDRLIDILLEALDCYYYHTCELYGNSICENSCKYLNDYIEGVNEI
jgi:hypothetical protein